jgi:hypothetical protein
MTDQNDVPVQSVQAWSWKGFMRLFHGWEGKKGVRFRLLVIYIRETGDKPSSSNGFKKEARKRMMR